VKHAEDSPSTSRAELNVQQSLVGRMPPSGEVARRMWPFFWAGLIVVGVSGVNLWLAVTLYPVRYANGVVCVCGRPEWVTYWTLAIYALPLVALVLVLYGAARDRRSHPRLAGPT
jgi:hypothetical protein